MQRQVRKFSQSVYFPYSNSECPSAHVENERGYESRGWDDKAYKQKLKMYKGKSFVITHMSDLIVNMPLEIDSGAIQRIGTCPGCRWV